MPAQSRTCGSLSVAPMNGRFPIQQRDRCCSTLTHDLSSMRRLRVAQCRIKVAKERRYASNSAREDRTCGLCYLCGGLLVARSGNKSAGPECNGLANAGSAAQGTGPSVIMGKPAGVALLPGTQISADTQVILGDLLGLAERPDDQPACQRHEPTPDQRRTHPLGGRHAGVGHQSTAAPAALLIAARTHAGLAWQYGRGADKSALRRYVVRQSR